MPLRSPEKFGRPLSTLFCPLVQSEAQPTVDEVSWRWGAAFKSIQISAQPLRVIEEVELALCHSDRLISFVEFAQLPLELRLQLEHGPLLSHWVPAFETVAFPMLNEPEH